MSAPGTETGPEGTTTTESGRTPAKGDDLRPGARQDRVEYVSRFVPFAAGIAAVIMAAVLGLIIVMRSSGLPFGIDEEWAEEVLEFRGGIWDVFGFGMDELGGGIMGVFIVPIGTAVVLLVLRRPWAALYLIVASAGSALMVQLLKNLFGRDRPEDILVIADYGSFPSGHVANAATIAVAIGIIAPKRWVWIAGAIYTFLMAVSRTYVGAHWLSDTIGGALVGAGMALLVWVLFARKLEAERLRRAAVIAERNAARAQAHVTPPAQPRELDPGGRVAAGRRTGTG